MFLLLEYAAQSWYYQSTLQCRSEVDHEVAFLQSHAARNSWLRVHDPEELWRELFQRSVSEAAPAVVDLETIVKDLLHEGGVVNAEGGDYSNTLQAASVGGHTLVIHLLLDKGADPKAEGGLYSNAHQTASVEGYTEVV